MSFSWAASGRSASLGSNRPAASPLTVVYVFSYSGSNANTGFIYNSSGFGWYIEIGGNNNTSDAYLYTSAGGPAISTSLQSGRKYAVMLTYDGSTAIARMSPLGAEGWLWTASQAVTAGTVDEFYLANDSVDEWFNGSIENYKIWRRILTPRDALREANTLNVQSRPGLFASVPMSTDDAGRDTSPNNNRFTIGGTPARDKPMVARARRRNLAHYFADVSAGTAASDASSAPTITGGATGASKAAGDASAAPTITGGATGASLAAAAGSSSPTITGGATGASLAAAAASSAPTITGGATGASLAAGVPSAAPTITADATGASLAAAAASSSPTITGDATGTTGNKSADASSSPTITADATGASKAAGDASSAPTITGDATSSSAGSDASASPTITGGATGASLAAAAASSAPTITGGATGAALGTAAASSSPTITGGAVGAALGAGVPSSAPTITGDATTAIGPVANSSPTITAGATGRALVAAAASSSPSIIGAASSGGGAGGDDEWHPDYWNQGWIPDYYAEP